MNTIGKRWCILRTSSRATLRLAETINAEGIEAWTPAAVSRPRLPKRRARITLRKPLLPQYVFADAAKLIELLGLSHRPLAGFTIMRDGERFAVIADRTLEPLREDEDDHERRRLRSIKHKPLSKGLRVPMPEGAWEGLSGIVQWSNGRKTSVDLGRFSVEIDTWLLLGNSLEGAAKPVMGIAA